MRGIKENFRNSVISSLPVVISVAALILLSIPYYIPGLSKFIPLLGLMMVYYWRMFTPSLMPLWFVFIYGIINDSLIGAPIGVSSLGYIIISTLLTGYIKMLGKSGFAYSWIGFAMVVCIYQLITWLVLSVYYSHILPPENAVLQVFFSILTYPAIHYLLGRANSVIRKV